ncbi:MAG TPA: nucleotide pyrophosphatase, partial [Reyranellaceae bacterium]|nr:nucleotide pyrophosphatase [Reyranellaceae bacterium]
AAVNMARQDEANPHGVRGKRWVVKEDTKPVPIGCGQHGGLGPDETRPFLMINGGRSTGTRREPSSLVDIAPTLLRHLGLPIEAVDGTPL